MASIWLLLVYGTGVVSLGSIVLIVVPRFRWTAVNLFIFVIGATLGVVGLVRLVFYKLISYDTLIHLTHRRQEELTDIVGFVGGLVGGTILVCLKMRLLKALESMIGPKNSGSG